jgi:hypothetical protein
MDTGRATKMWVVTVDKNGKELGDGRWVKIPKPDVFKRDGVAQIENYVSRLLRSTARFTSIIIATPNQQVAVILWQRGGIPSFSLSLQWRSEQERERAVRQFFSERGLSISEDYLAGNGDVPDATRCLGYFLPSDGQFITGITQDALRQIYGVREQDPLNFTFQEHHDAI